jgi:N-methylhydantoinase B
LDPVTLTVVNNRLINICRQMGITMQKTALTTLFNEALDFSCVIFNRDVELIGQAEFIPCQIGSSILTVRWCIEELGLENFKPGDVLIHNDPFRGGAHLPEHTTIKPVYFDGELFGFACNVAHFIDTGACEVGGFSAQEVYQEGLRLPPVKLVSEGKDVKDVWKIILANHRTPRYTIGDLRAIIGSLFVAERSTIELLNDYGVQTVNQATKDLMDISEEIMRSEIRKMPKGEYDYEDYMDDDGYTDKTYKIKVTLVVRGDELIIDFTGTDPQAPGPINATYGATVGACYNAVLLVNNLAVPINSGLYRPIKIIAPIGTIVNVKYPGASIVGSHETGPRITGAILGAFSKIFPDRAAAPDGATPFSFLFFGEHPDTGNKFVGFQYEGVGWGARKDHDGNNAVGAVCAARARMTPTEVMETRYPILVKEHRLVQDSGGAGTRRGGLSSTSTYKFLAPVIFSVFTDRMKIKPFGLFGGNKGGGAKLFYKRKGEKRFKDAGSVFGKKIGSKLWGIKAEVGDEIKIVAPGSGGYGDPKERELELVLEDVKEGFVSKESAVKDYYVAIEGGTRYQIDHNLTEQLRSRRGGLH